MTVDSEIEILQNEVADRATELEAIRTEAIRLAGLKGQSLQSIIDLADCRVVIDAVFNSSRAFQAAEKEKIELIKSLTSLRDDFKALAEEVYRRNEEAEKCKRDIESLENQIKIVESNQEVLQAGLAKLKVKNETIRVRAAGAESDLLQLKRRLADEDCRYQAAISQALNELSGLQSKRETSSDEIRNLLEESQAELIELEKFLKCQIDFIRQ